MLLDLVKCVNDDSTKILAAIRAQWKIKICVLCSNIKNYKMGLKQAWGPMLLHKSHTHETSPGNNLYLLVSIRFKWIEQEYVIFHKNLKLFHLVKFLKPQGNKENNPPSTIYFRIKGSRKYGTIKRRLIWVENRDDFDWLNKLNMIIR